MLDVRVDGKSYRIANGGRLEALGNVSFNVSSGEFVCLTGPSGCGKTTTLRLILGLDGDYDGKIRLPEGRIAAVFQEPRLLPWRTVEQNIRLALPQELNDASLDGLFVDLGIEGTATLFQGIVSGMARRVAIARAFALEPALLTLDEPFVSLDEPTAERLRRLLLSVWKARPTAALMVTHNMREAAELADRIIVMSPRPGRIVADVRIETPRELRGSAEIDHIVAQIAQSS